MERLPLLPASPPGSPLPPLPPEPPEVSTVNLPTIFRSTRYLASRCLSPASSPQDGGERPAGGDSGVERGDKPIHSCFQGARRSFPSQCRLQLPLSSLSPLALLLLPHPLGHYLTFGKSDS